MRKCPNCSKTYDDSWSVCLHCEAPLTGSGQDKAKVSLGDNFIGKQINRTNRNLLLTNVGIMVSIALLWLNNFFYGIYSFWWLAIIVPIGLASWNIFRFWKRSKSPSLHPINIALSKYGPIDKIVKIINEEAKFPKVEVKPIIITDSWLFKPSIYGLEMVLLGDLAWVYNKVTTHYTNGIRTGESHSVIIYKRDRKSFETSCGQFASSMLMARVTEAAPWVVSGYSDEIKALWDTNMNAFIAHVDQKKREANRVKNA